jgi:acetolactate synthase-1/3 small subunit
MSNDNNADDVAMDDLPARHTIVALVQDRPGVLSRIIGVFRRRDINIERLVVEPSDRDGVSRITWVVRTDSLGAVLSQLGRLVEVLDARSASTPSTTTGNHDNGEAVLR